MTAIDNLLDIVNTPSSSTETDPEKLKDLASYLFLNCLLLKNVMEHVSCFSSHTADRFLLILESV